MAVKMYMKGINSKGNALISLMDGSLTFEVKSWREGVIYIEPIPAWKDGVIILSKDHELHTKQFVRLIVDCFSEKSTLKNIKAIEFELKKIKFHVDKYNANVDDIMRHFYDNCNAKTPKEYI